MPTPPDPIAHGETGATLDADTLDLLFPAFLRIDETGRILASGASLQHHHGGTLQGLAFFDAFVIERPQRIDTLAALTRFPRNLVLHARSKPRLRLQGIGRADGSDHLLFLGFIPDLGEGQERLDFKVRDFSPTDSTQDLLVAHYIGQSLLADTRVLARELEAKRGQAEAANEAKSTFLAHMSHELRTPMNGVLGMAEAVLSDGLSESQRTRVEAIRTSGEGLMRVLNDILDLSKVEAGQVELEIIPFSVSAFMRSATELFAMKAEEQGVAFSIKMDDAADDWFLGDPTRLRQVLTNILSNAVKFTSHGRIDVTVSTQRGAGDNDTQLMFSVADTGMGLSDAAKASLFQPFSQADQSITRKFGGTGLGLSIAKRLCRLMGGDIWVDSAVGQGSTFSFTVQVERAAAPTDATDAATGGAAPARRPLSVLVAEDNVVNRMVITALLEKHPFQLTVTVNGSEALEQWEAQSFDVILMDMQMPVMDGLQAAQEIRRLETEQNRDRTPIIAVTANAMNHQINSYIDAGIDAVIAKPIQLDVLLAELDRIRLSVEMRGAEHSNDARPASDTS